ncbi:MAG TPA: hypothetical protein VMH41_16920 [Mycobacteriales bacterium]|nr:hypothetical protein [Mycobacteriales bacterium]
MTSRYHARPRRSEWPARLLGGVLYAALFYGAGVGAVAHWRDEVSELAEQLLMALESLRDGGYQPRYNGRPSCPVCGNFVDDEETHTPGCVLVAAVNALPDIVAALRETERLQCPCGAPAPWARASRRGLADTETGS